MAKSYIKLRQRMQEYEVTQNDLSLVLGRKHCYISDRFNKRRPWNLNDIQAIGEYLEIPREDWLDVFLDQRPKRTHPGPAK